MSSFGIHVYHFDVSVCPRSKHKHRSWFSRNWTCPIVGNGVLKKGCMAFIYTFENSCNDVVIITRNCVYKNMDIPWSSFDCRYENIAKEGASV